MVLELSLDYSSSVRYGHLLSGRRMSDLFVVGMMVSLEVSG